MNYIILETQTNNGVTAIVTPTAYSDRNEAESIYHQKASAAATSNVEIHTVAFLTEDGRLVRQSECYRHTAPQPGPEE